MNGNEAFVKVVGLCVLGGIATKVYYVIQPVSRKVISGTSSAVADLAKKTGEKIGEATVSSLK